MQSRTHQMWRLVFNLAKDAWMTTRCTSYSAYSASILLKSLCLMDLEDLASLNGTSFRAEIRSLRGRSRWSSSEVPNFLPSELSGTKLYWSRAFRAFGDSEPSPTYFQLNFSICGRTFQERARRKTSQPAAKPFWPVTPFLLLDCYWSTAKAWPASAMFFEHVEHPRIRTQVLKR